jgi:murein DD-endopeptidase MepM/ murein hydrolase activator NlpD
MKAIRIFCALAATMLAIFSAGVALEGEIPAANSLPLTRYLRVAVVPSSKSVDAFVGDGVAHAAFELYVANFGDKPVRLVAVRLEGAGGAEPYFKTIDRDALESAFSKLGFPRQTRVAPILGRGESAVIFLFPNFGAPERAPASVVTSLDVEEEGKPDSEQRITIAPIAVRHHAAVVIQPPLTGRNWLAANGPSNTSIHRRAIFIVDGVPRIGQRFAIDFVKLGPDGRTYRGDQHNNRSYYAYRQPITAVAAGTIVATLDGVPDNIPESGNFAVELRLANAGGNFVAERIGDGRYVMYAHLEPGSLEVKPGDQVKAGQTIASLGNTGSSTEPHLHIQVCNAPSFLGSDGIPYEFDSFTLKKYRIDRKNDQPVHLEIDSSAPVKQQTPMEDELIDFGAR